MEYLEWAEIPFILIYVLLTRIYFSHFGLKETTVQKWWINSLKTKFLVKGSPECKHKHTWIQIQYPEVVNDAETNYV